MMRCPLLAVKWKFEVVMGVAGNQGLEVWD